MAVKEIFEAVVIEQITIRVSFMPADEITEARHVAVGKGLLIDIFLNNQAGDTIFFDDQFTNVRRHIIINKVLKKMPSDIRASSFIPQEVAGRGTVSHNLSTI